MLFSYLCVFACIATVPAALAAPLFTPPGSSLLQTRDSVASIGQLCGVEVRKMVKKKDCGTKPVYIQKDPTKADITTMPESALPKGTKAECDHTIELQMLKKVTDASGFCDVVKAMLALDPKLSKAALLQGIGDAISAPDNLNNLEESVNGAKGKAVLAVIGGNAVANNVVTQAAYNFYSVLAVRTPALNVARVIDAEMDKAVQTAQAALSKLTPPASMDPNVRQKNPADAKYIALHTALAQYANLKVNMNMQALFQRVLAADPAP